MTQRSLSVRLKEHSTRLSSGAVGQHFSECEHAQFLATLQDQLSLLIDNPLPLNNPSLIENLVFNNYKILHLIKSNNHHILAFLEALLIKHNKPFLKEGFQRLLRIGSARNIGGPHDLEIAQILHVLNFF